MSRRLAVLPLVIAAASACADLSTTPPRSITSIVLDRDTVLLTVGDSMSLRATVLDEHGDPMEVPAWLSPAWSASEPAIAAPVGGVIRARGPGQTLASVRLAELSAEAVVRVNPREIMLRIDSVRVTRVTGSSSVLRQGEEATVRVYVRADQPNFFPLDVQVDVTRDGDLLGTVAAGSGVESIPHGPRPGVWTAMLPGELVKHGNSLVVRADPGSKLAHRPSSQRRHPATDEMPLAFELAVQMQSVLITQVTQRLDGSVPLIAGRDGLLRVFMTSTETTSEYPMVRATFSMGGFPIARYDLRRSEPSFPQEVRQGFLSQSWNMRVPGDLLQPGIALSVEFDPSTPTTPGSVRRIPVAGAIPLDVRPVPTLWGRMVPVRETAFGTTGNIHSGNLNGYVDALWEKFPLADYGIDLRTPYTTTARLDTRDGWSQLLQEMAALRIADGSGRYYYGVLTSPGGSGLGGLGYVGWPAAIGYDFEPHSYETYAHELGHNLGLLHAPCGSPASIDEHFPYANGGLGTWGYDVYGDTLVAPTRAKDLMSYCTPEWISDYNFEKVLAFRDEWDWVTTGPDIAAASEPSLLVWGRVMDGRLTLEPSFTLDMAPALPRSGGAYRIEGTDDAGRVIFSYSFEPSQHDHGAGASFTFAIPNGVAQPDRLAAIRFIGPAGGTVLRRAAVTPARPALTLHDGGDATRITWDDSVHPIALIRDRRTGEILSFARGGVASVHAHAGALDILLSDGVRSVRPSIR